MAWMKSAYRISTSGLPIGMQIVGRHHDELGVLQPAYAFEQATKIGNHRPAVALR